jgi:hypothetical protein
MKTCDCCEHRSTNHQLCGFWLCEDCRKRLLSCKFALSRLRALATMHPRPSPRVMLETDHIMGGRT